MASGLQEEDGGLGVRKDSSTAATSLTALRDRGEGNEGNPSPSTRKCTFFQIFTLVAQSGTASEFSVRALIEEPFG
jgi:hypothetical protein